MITIANTNKISTAPQLTDESTVLTGYILHNIQFLWACAYNKVCWPCYSCSLSIISILKSGISPVIWQECIHLKSLFLLCSLPLLSQWQCLLSLFKSVSFRSLTQLHRQLWGLREACPDPVGVMSHSLFIRPCLCFTSFTPLQCTMQQQCCWVK